MFYSAKIFRMTFAYKINYGIPALKLQCVHRKFMCYQIAHVPSPCKYLLESGNVYIHSVTQRERLYTMYYNTITEGRVVLDCFIKSLLIFVQLDFKRNRLCTAIL